MDIGELDWIDKKILGKDITSENKFYWEDVHVRSYSKDLLYRNNEFSNKMLAKAVDSAKSCHMDTAFMYLGQGIHAI